MGGDDQNWRDKLKPALRPRTRLFFSIDLVGSTAFKQAVGEDYSLPSENDGAEPGWQKTMLQFYENFAYQLGIAIKQFKEHNESDAYAIKECLYFWKSRGDEVLYTAEVNRIRQIGALVAIWMRAVREYGKLVREDHNLDVKAAAWIASFPYKNREVVFSTPNGLPADMENIETAADASIKQYSLLNSWYHDEEDKRIREGRQIDFLGPAIDTGFRIAERSTPEKMCVNLELAMLLNESQVADFQFEEGKKYPRTAIFYDGSHTFKGVVGGRNYPVFWIAVDTDNKLLRLEGQLTNQHHHDHHGHGLHAGQIKDYCNAYIEKK